MAIWSITITTSTISPDPGSASPERAGAFLDIDLDAIADNYRLLRSRLGEDVTCAAVIKANAYGLGAEWVGPALHAAGARDFFVAHLEEGIRLRACLRDARIAILHGVFPGTEKDFEAHDLIPVLNEPGQVEIWAAHGRRRLAAGRPTAPAILHLDTGMNRLGLSEREAIQLAAAPEQLQGIDLTYVASHFIAADDKDCPATFEQLNRFNAMRALLPPARASLANSSGIFLGPEYHFDLARPGVALAGVNPTPHLPNPMQPVVRLRGKIIQIREIDRGESVGYGAAWQAERPSRIATVPVGYADGYLRCLGNRIHASLAGVRLPLAGRVSMDLITLDVTDLPEELCRVGEFVDLIGGEVDIDDVAAAAGTIAYEILTSLGNRYHRRYLSSSQEAD